MCIAYALTHLNFSKWQHRHFNIFHKQTLFHLQSNSIAESIGIRFLTNWLYACAFLAGNFKYKTNEDAVDSTRRLFLTDYTIHRHFIWLFQIHKYIQFAAFCLHFFYFDTAIFSLAKQVLDARSRLTQRKKANVFMVPVYFLCLCCCCYLFSFMSSLVDHQFVGPQKSC